MKSALIQARIEPDLKKKVEKILNQIGLSTNEAINLFFKRITIERGIPFPLKIPNKETLGAMKDIEQNKNLHGPFNSSDELWSSLNKDD